MKEGEDSPDDLSKVDDLPFYDDVSDFSDTKSMMSHRTVNEIEYVPPDCDIDLYIEEMMKNNNKRFMKQLELKHEQRMFQLKM